MDASRVSLLDDAIRPVRDILQADGADVEVLGWDDDVLALRLRLDEASCAECVLPRASLEQTMLAMLRSSLPSVRAVRLTDPREPGTTEN